MTARFLVQPAMCCRNMILEQLYDFFGNSFGANRCPLIETLGALDEQIVQGFRLSNPYAMTYCQSFFFQLTRFLTYAKSSYCDN